jgi:Flp pilus assembly protein TadG
MISLIRLVRRFRQDRNGSVVIEFALIGPALIVALIGVLQVGMAMQSYNAIRSVTAETSRYALVEHQKDNVLTNAEIQSEAVDIATGAPYLLKSSALTITVTDAATQRVSGATEKTVTVTYQVPSFLPLMNFVAPSVNHSRPIFLLDN